MSRVMLVRGNVSTNVYPSQEIDVRLLCVKGIGQDHAKFSPVGKHYLRHYPYLILKIVKIL